MCEKKKLCLTNQKPHRTSLEFEEHIKTLENKVACAFGILTKLKYIFPNTTLKLYFAQMHPISLYKYLGWHVSLILTKTLNIAKKALWVISGSHYQAEANWIYRQLESFENKMV